MAVECEQQDTRIKFINPWQKCAKNVNVFIQMQKKRCWMDDFKYQGSFKRSKLETEKLDHIIIRAKVQAIYSLVWIKLGFINFTES